MKETKKDHGVHEIPLLAQEFTRELGEAFSREGGLSVSSAFLRGGAVLGEFEPKVSDLDIFIVSSSEGEGALKRIFEVQQEVGQKPPFDSFSNLLRHPATVLTTAEAALYLRAQPAKLIYPLLEGIYQPFYGKVPDDLFPAEIDWPQEFFYGSLQFYRNIQTLGRSGARSERRLGKQVFYFLRFLGMADSSVYALGEQEVVQLAESLDPQWPDCYRSLKSGAQEAVDVLPQLVRLAEGSIDRVAKRRGLALAPQEIARRDNLAQLAWTIEKTRWDFWLVDEEKIAERILSGPGNGIWGFGRQQVAFLVTRLGADGSLKELGEPLGKGDYLGYFRGPYQQKLRTALKAAQNQALS